MLQPIVDALREKDGVHDWLARHIVTSSTQYYVIGQRIENSRTVSSQKAVVTVMNDHPATKVDGMMRGEAQVTVVPSDQPHLAEKLEQAVFMASVTDNPPYGLAGTTEYPVVEVADAEMQSDPRAVAERLVHELLTTLKDEHDVRLSSAEVFVDSQEVTIRNSRGVEGAAAQTRLLLDFVLLASGDNEEMESHIAFERRRSLDLDVPAMAQRQAQYARDAIVAGTPRTGTFPVVVSDDALVELLMSEGYSPLILRAAAQLKYQKLSPWEPGTTILSAEATGDPFTMYSNALLPYGVRSGSFDHEGLPGQRVLIVNKGVFNRFWASQRHAEYLNIPPTGRFGNMELAVGSVPYNNLFESDERLYHVVAFSAMTPDPITGDFVGEIRLGYEIEKARRRPIRGGSISGNLFEVLAAARLSREQVFWGNYLGPRGALFAGITVAGD
jgi:predicted Zn-dependent protease